MSKNIIEPNFSLKSKEILLNQEVIISATGNARFIKADMVAKNATLIDVGTNLDDNGKLCGDCDFEAISKTNSISPVPGGVGPLTLASLLENIVLSAERKIK